MEKRKNYIDIESDTVESAIEKGIDLLKTTLENVDVEILSEKQNGLFSFGKKKAVVRLYLLNGSIPEELVKNDEKKEEEHSKKKSINEIFQMVSKEKDNEDKKRKDHKNTNEKREDNEDLKVKLIEEKFVQLTKLMGFSVQPQINFLNNKYRIIIKETPDANLLIGKNGKTIDALQHVLNKILIKEKINKPVYLDIKGYVKQKRKNRFLKNERK